MGVGLREECRKGSSGMAAAGGMEGSPALGSLTGVWVVLCQWDNKRKSISTHSSVVAHKHISVSCAKTGTSVHHAPCALSALLLKFLPPLPRPMFLALLQILNEL